MSKIPLLAQDQHDVLVAIRNVAREHPSEPAYTPTQMTEQACREFAIGGLLVAQSGGYVLTTEGRIAAESPYFVGTMVASSVDGYARLTTPTKYGTGVGVLYCWSDGIVTWTTEREMWPNVVL